MYFTSSPVHEAKDFTYKSFNAKKKNFKHYVIGFQPEIDRQIMEENQTLNRDLGMAFDANKISR